MSQPVLTEMLALAVAIVLTTSIAAATLTKPPSRAFRLTAVVAVIALTVVAFQRAGLRINFTESMPVGIYLLSPLFPSELKRGMIVAACAPVRAAEIGRRRGYIAVGACPGDTELLLKTIGAVAGDDVPGGHSKPASDGHLKTGHH